MTDPRVDDGLFEAIRRLPKGAGVVLRHDHLPRQQRERLARVLKRMCQRHRLVFAVARDAMLARRVGADLVHQPSSSPGIMPFSKSVHNLRDASIASRQGADVVFVSPLFATRSHPGQPPLSLEEADALARKSGATAIALGGMTESRFQGLRTNAFHGYAGIDCWIS